MLTQGNLCYENYPKVERQLLKTLSEQAQAARLEQLGMTLSLPCRVHCLVSAVKKIANGNTATRCISVKIPGSTISLLSLLGAR